MLPFLLSNDEPLRLSLFPFLPPRRMDGLSFSEVLVEFFFNEAKHFHPFSVPKLAKHHIKECAGRPTHEGREREEKDLPPLPQSPHHKTQFPRSLPALLKRGSAQQLRREAPGGRFFSTFLLLLLLLLRTVSLPNTAASLPRPDPRTKTLVNHTCRLALSHNWKAHNTRK